MIVAAIPKTSAPAVHPRDQGQDRYAPAQASDNVEDRLPQAVVVERDVELPLNTSVNVPGGFAVANCGNANRGRACVGHGLVATVDETSMNTEWGCGCARG